MNNPDVADLRARLDAFESDELVAKLRQHHLTGEAAALARDILRERHVNVERSIELQQKKTFEFEESKAKQLWRSRWLVLLYICAGLTLGGAIRVAMGGALYYVIALFAEHTLQAISDLADLLYDFLPGSGHAGWKGHVSFKTVAEKVGVGNFWQPGSKRPMITALLQRTYEHRRDKLEQLIFEIVRGGIAYRQNQQSPVRSDDIKRLNGYVFQLGFKFPDLWDPEFLNALDRDRGERAKAQVDTALAREQQKAAEDSARLAKLRNLKDEFFGLHSEPSPQAAGLKFEKILNELFELSGMKPRPAFRVVGEQIDGSFDLDQETYLLEAKWHKEPVSEAALLIFRGKIEGKSAFTRGLFVSLNGITDGARQAIIQGKQPTFFAIDGYDLTMVLSEQITLPDFLRQRRRLLAEEGQVVVPFPQLWLGSRCE